jgi:predicted O-methyltransferase YrrM
MLSQLFIAKQYLQYWLKAKNRHGVHSPFIYAFNDEVLADSRKFYHWIAIEELRKVLLQNNSTILIEDFGAGSHHADSNIRTIKSIAKYAAKQKKHGELLFKMVNYYGAKNILELGTSLGIGTSYMAAANANAHVTTIEGSKSIAAEATKNFDHLKLKNITQIIGKFDDVLPKISTVNNSFDFVFVDGNHQYEATITYFETLLPNMPEESILVFDDIHWSSGMWQAWNKIINHPQVLLSVDVFQFGIIFFRKEAKEKQHFVLKL